MEGETVFSGRGAIQNGIQVSRPRPLFSAMVALILLGSCTPCSEFAGCETRCDKPDLSERFVFLTGMGSGAFDYSVKVEHWKGTLDGVPFDVDFDNRPTECVRDAATGEYSCFLTTIDVIAVDDEGAPIRVKDREVARVGWLLQAVPSEGWEFVGFSGPCTEGAEYPTANSIRVSDKPLNTRCDITARPISGGTEGDGGIIVGPNDVMLTVDSGGGTILASAPGVLSETITGSRTLVIPRGTEVLLEAYWYTTPSKPFTEWRGTLGGCTGQTNSIKLTLADSGSCNATF